MYNDEGNMRVSKLDMFGKIISEVFLNWEGNSLIRMYEYLVFNGLLIVQKYEENINLFVGLKHFKKNGKLKKSKITIGIVHAGSFLGKF